MSTDDEFPCPPQHKYGSMVTFVRDLLELPGSQVSIERTARRLRLRFKMVDPDTGKRVRRALELPNDDRLASSLIDIIRSHRQTRREERGLSRASRLRAEQRWRKSIRRRLHTACPHGRTVKRRLGLVFDLAADLGYVFLKDFLERRPWLAGSPSRTGRRCKRR